MPDTEELPVAGQASELKMAQRPQGHRLPGAYPIQSTSTGEAVAKYRQPSQGINLNFAPATTKAISHPASLARRGLHPKKKRKHSANKHYLQLKRENREIREQLNTIIAMQKLIM